MTCELRFERLIHAGPEVVFDLFTTPGGQEAFYRQEGPGWIVRTECDLRVGGRWNVEFGPAPDQICRHEHVFAVIDRPNRLTVTTTEIRPDASSFATETDFFFEKQRAHTLMRMVTTGFPTEELRHEHTLGLPYAFGQFDVLVLHSLED